VNANIVVMAAVLAVSPMPIVASLLFLTSEHGRAKAAALAVGWFGALAVIGAATIYAATHLDVASSSGSSTASAIVDVALGVIALVYAVVVRRRAASGEMRQPTWMDRVDRMRPVVALALGAFLPPYVLVIAAANEILRTDTSTTVRVVAVATVAILGSVGVLTPLIASVVVRDSDAMLARWRTSLLDNWATVLIWLMVFIGVYLLLKGVYELTS